MLVLIIVVWIFSSTLHSSMCALTNPDLSHPIRDVLTMSFTRSLSPECWNAIFSGVRGAVLKPRPLVVCPWQPPQPRPRQLQSQATFRPLCKRPHPRSIWRWPRSIRAAADRIDGRFIGGGCAGRSSNSLCSDLRAAGNDWRCTCCLPGGSWREPGVPYARRPGGNPRDCYCCTSYPGNCCPCWHRRTWGKRPNPLASVLHVKEFFKCQISRPDCFCINGTFCLTWVCIVRGANNYVLTDTLQGWWCLLGLLLFSWAFSPFHFAWKNVLFYMNLAYVSTGACASSAYCECTKALEQGQDSASCSKQCGQSKGQWNVHLILYPNGDGCLQLFSGCLEGDLVLQACLTLCPWHIYRQALLLSSLDLQHSLIPVGVHE